MSAAAGPALRVVKGSGAPALKDDLSDPDVMLAEIVPELIRAEEVTAALRGMVDSWRRQLAKKRGVAFIREERIRQEFGS